MEYFTLLFYTTQVANTDEINKDLFVFFSLLFNF